MDKENNVLMGWRNYRIVGYDSGVTPFHCYKKTITGEVIVCKDDCGDAIEQLGYALVKKELIFINRESQPIVRLSDSRDSDIKSGFKLGNTVKLRSGGPVMTLVQHASEDTWRCAWFDDKGYSQADLPEVALSTSW
jgi:uncharacterized protein YodC (DUF2158 family)